MNFPGSSLGYVKVQFLLRSDRFDSYRVPETFRYLVSPTSILFMFSITRLRPRARERRGPAVHVERHSAVADPRSVPSSVSPRPDAQKRLLC